MGNKDQAKVAKEEEEQREEKERITVTESAGFFFPLCIHTMSPFFF